MPHPVRGIKPLSEHLFLLFANNYGFPITLSCLAATHFSHHTLNSNIAIGSLPTLQTLHGMLALFEKIYYGDPIFPVISSIGEDIQ